MSTVIAVGDPQGSFEAFIQVLDRHGLLRDDGTLRAGVHLVSMGDHFDFGPPEQRARATRAGETILSWLASHSPEQVTVLLGNHDLARVCELAHFTDEAFELAHAEARALYASRGDPRDFLARFPMVPDVECLARDYSCFAASQRVLVTELLRTRRLRLAAHHDGVLLVHAGVTLDDLESIGVAPTNAEVVAAGLNAFLDERVATWSSGPLSLAPLHLPGSAETGEGRGALYHRPCDPSTQDASRLAGPPRRRFDPRRLPNTFPQAIGHIRDGKCRELMPHWSPAGPGRDGPLRSLTVDGDVVQYHLGCAPGARLFFTDGGLSHAAPDRYELFDVRARRPASAPRT